MKKYLLISIISLFPLLCMAESEQLIYEALQLRSDDAKQRSADNFIKGSHISAFLPSLPYIYISHSINGALFRPANNEQGWQYDLATAHQQIDDTTYEFTLRKGVVFQDGITAFNADMVLLNMQYFKKAPFLFSKIHRVFDRVEKIDDYTVRFYLTEKYGMFLNDVIWLQFYTPAYLEKFGWNGKPTCPNLAEPGAYGIGPYILIEGYAEGDRQTPVVKLKANPYYWDKRYPKIEYVTIYTELSTAEAKKMALYEERLDIATIPFNSRVETILSPYAKLVTSPSTNNFAIHMNLINGNPRLLDKNVRLALNQALHQENLLYFTMDGEGQLSPTLAAPDYPGVRSAMQSIKPYSVLQNPYDAANQARLKGILSGLELQVFTQERFLFLWRGIESQLKKVGVKLNLTVTNSEKEIFAQLLSTNLDDNTMPWDLLIWGDDDWFFNHPWSAFLVYRTYDSWSTIFPDPLLDAYVEDVFKVAIGEAGFNEAVYRVMQHVYDNAYMLFVPTPNKVLAMNKEIFYVPYKQAIVPLWEIQVTPEHHSVRSGEYPSYLKQPLKMLRLNF